MKKKKTLLLKSTMLFLALSAAFVHFYLPRIITEIRNPLLAVFRKANDDLSHLEKIWDEIDNGKHFDFESFDGVQLSSHITYADTNEVKGVVILLHGIRSNKSHFKSMSQMLSQKGYHAVALDLRAHGLSEGVHCTFGVKEKKDVSALIDILEKMELKTENIGVWGQSLGGAIALQSLEYDKRLTFGVVESTFSDFQQITKDYFEYNMGFDLNSLTNYLINRASIIADFDPIKAKPIESCAGITQPVLLVHGKEDRRISIKYARQNFAALNSSRKQFIELENANHLNIWKVGGQSYLKHVFDFMHDL